MLPSFSGPLCQGDRRGDAAQRLEVARQQALGTWKRQRFAVLVAEAGAEVADRVLQPGVVGGEKDTGRN